MLYHQVSPDLAKLKVVGEDESSPGGYLEGYASVFGNTDLGGDIVEKGAFKKTLKDRVPNGSVKLVDSHKVFLGTEAVIGVIREAKEDEYGLWFTAKMSVVQKAQDIRTKVKEGVLNALSFGYDVVKEQFDAKGGVNFLKELKLYEVSVVIWGMNPKAELTVVKTLLFDRWPTVANVEAEWNEQEAHDRFKTWVSPHGQESWDEAEWNRYRKGFLLVDDKDCKFLLVDVVDSAPSFVFKAVEKALHDFRSSGLLSITFNRSEKTVLETYLASLYNKFSVAFPSPDVIEVAQPSDVASLISQMKSDVNAMSTSALVRELVFDSRR